MQSESTEQISVVVLWILSLGETGFLHRHLFFATDETENIFLISLNVKEKLVFLLRYDKHGFVTAQIVEPLMEVLVLLDLYCCVWGHGSF